MDCRRLLISKCRRCISRDDFTRYFCALNFPMGWFIWLKEHCSVFNLDESHDEHLAEWPRDLLKRYGLSGEGEIESG